MSQPGGRFVKTMSRPLLSETETSIQNILNMWVVLLALWINVSEAAAALVLMGIRAVPDKMGALVDAGIARVMKEGEGEN